MCQLSFVRYQGMVDGLVRGLKKHGGKLYLSSHVDEILLEGGKAVGVKLRGGAVIKAGTAVVTNATLWDIRKLLPPGAFVASSDFAFKIKWFCFGKRLTLVETYTSVLRKSYVLGDAFITV